VRWAVRAAVPLLSCHIVSWTTTKSTLNAHNWSSFSVNLIIEHTNQDDLHVNHVDIPQFLLSPPLVPLVLPLSIGTS
jgi:hypothetical protein